MTRLINISRLAATVFVMTFNIPTNMSEATLSASCASCANPNSSSPSFPRPAHVWTTAMPMCARTLSGQWHPSSSTPSHSSPMPRTFFETLLTGKPTAPASVIPLPRSCPSATRRPPITSVQPLIPFPTPTSSFNWPSSSSCGRMQCRTLRTRCAGDNQCNK